MSFVCVWQRGAEVKLVPYDHDISQEEFDGLFISNGPGDPTKAEAIVENVRKVSKMDGRES